MKQTKIVKPADGDQHDDIMTDRDDVWTRAVMRMGMASLMACLLLTCHLRAVQTVAAVVLRVEPGTLVRNRTSDVRLTIEIPPGSFIPAETRASVSGLWVKPWWLYNRALPTLPDSREVRLPGSDTPVLAYTGTITIRLPLETFVGTLEGPQEIELAVGYQRCDAVRCDPPTQRTVAGNMTIVKAIDEEGFLAFRVDDSHVAIVTREQSPNGRALPETRMAARLVMPLLLIPPGDVAMATFVGPVSMGTHWILGSRNRRSSAVASAPAAIAAGCGDVMPLAVVADVTSQGFSADRENYFLAWRAAARSLGAAPPPPSAAAPITGDQRVALEALLDRQRRAILATVFSPKLGPRDFVVAETAYDRAVRDGRGRLVYHVESHELAPDGLPRLYVRAHWTVGSTSLTGLTLWVRVDGSRLVVERADAGVTRSARLREFGGHANIAADARHAGMLLNVIPGSDGWAYLLMGQAFYESVVVKALKYTTTGPVETGIEWAHGC